MLEIPLLEVSFLGIPFLEVPHLEVPSLETQRQIDKHRHREPPAFAIGLSKSIPRSPKSHISKYEFVVLRNGGFQNCAHTR